MPGRFAMRLMVSALAAIVLVIAGADPLNPSAAFGKTFPDPLRHFEAFPPYLIELVAILTAVVAVTAVLIALVRSRTGRGSSPLRAPLAASAAAFGLALPGLSWLSAKYAGLPLPLPGRALFALTGTSAAAMTWFAAVAVDWAGLAERRGAGRLGATDDGWDDEPESTGPYGARQDRQRSDGGRRAEPGYGWGGAPPPRGGDLRYPALAALAAEAIHPDDQGGGRDDSWAGGGDDSWAGGRDDSWAGAPGSQGYGDDGPYTGEVGSYAGEFGYREPVSRADQGGRETQLFGQIAIYTLIEDRMAEFDRLTEHVVAQVRAREPNTLAFIVHAVPTAPMQRIMYEVYRDRNAYEDHLRQPYVIRYEEERRPFVLATNLIELGLRQAKVSPFPSIDAISDILSESGIDLTGVARSPRGGMPPPSADPRSRPALRELEAPGRIADDDYPGNGRPEYYEAEQEYERPYQGGWAEIRGDEGYR
jgi:quinol monooxygenase YgiN